MAKSEVALVALVVGSYCYGFISAWALSRDGKSKFWTGYCDIVTLRILWEKP